jgi:hypothetical protein
MAALIADDWMLIAGESHSSIDCATIPHAEFAN